MYKMKILVTGGAGFLGSHLCNALLRQKSTKDQNIVICLDNLSTSSIDNIMDLLDNPNFQFINCDVEKLCHELVGDVDRIFHLASIASPPLYKKNPLQTISANTIGTEQVLKLAKKCKARVLYASTSEVYGDPIDHPQKEEHYGNVNSFGPRSCYDESKRLGEAYCYEYQRLGVKVMIARIFNTYGPNMDPNDGRVVSNFINQCLYNKDITLYGSGTQTRSFCYVDDMIVGLMRLMTSNYQQPVNLGNPRELSIVQIAHKIKDLTGSNSTIIHCDAADKDDPNRRCPCIDTAKSYLSWEPQVDLHTGLINTICYFKKKKEMLECMKK